MPLLASQLWQFFQGALYIGKQGNCDSVRQHKLDILEQLVGAANSQPVPVAYLFQFDKEWLLQRFRQHIH
jgi:hypothetical protein